MPCHSSATRFDWPMPYVIGPIKQGAISPAERDQQVNSGMIRVHHCTNAA